MQSYKTIDEYLQIQPKEFQKPLENLRKIIKKYLPNATEKIGRGMPGFQVNGKWVVGFASFKKHMSFFPHSGSILQHFENDLKDFTHTKSSLHFTRENPIPEKLIEKIIKKKMEMDILN